MEADTSVGEYDAVKKRILQKIFNQIDINNDKVLHKNELALVLKQYQGKDPDSDVLDDMFDKVDLDHGGSVSFNEFYIIFHNMDSDRINLSSVLKRWATFATAGDIGSEFSTPVPTKKSEIPLWQFFLAGGTGGILSRTLTAPLDKLKIIAQTKQAGSGSLMATYHNLIKQGGWRSLWSGNSVCCARIFPFGGIVCITYGNILKLLPSDKELDWKEPIWRMIAGAGAGAIATLGTYPLDLVRARMAVDDKARFAGTFKKIIQKEGGVAGLFKGIRPSLWAVAPFCAVQQASYDTLKFTAFKKDYEPSIPMFLFCGALAGSIAHTVVHPLDVVRRRMQVQDAKGAHWTVRLRNLKQQGVSSLYAGIVPSIAKIAPAVAISLITRDAILGRLD